MFFKIQRKLLGIKYNVDVCEQTGTMLTVRGWLCSEKCKISKVHFLIEDKKGNKFNIKGRYGISRNDVYQDLKKKADIMSRQLWKTSKSMKCGLYFHTKVKNIEYIWEA